MDSRITLNHLEGVFFFSNLCLLNMIPKALGFHQSMTGMAQGSLRIP